MGNDFGVGIGSEFMALAAEFVAQRLEVLDDPIVNNGDFAVLMGMGIVGGRPAVRCPTRVADSQMAEKRLRREASFKVLQLACSPAAGDLPVLQRRHPGGIVAAVFEPLERFKKRPGDRRRAEDADDSAHFRLSDRLVASGYTFRCFARNAFAQNGF